MKTREFVNKFRSRYLWMNIAAMAAVVLCLVAVLVVGLGFYTHHGERIEIPDVRRHSIEDAKRVLSDLGLDVQVSDTGYVKSYEPGVVLEQTPASGVYVKSGRVVYLTINALDTPMLTLPDIIDNSSLREAQAKLTSMGFRLGEPQYVLGEKDWVYGVKCKNRNLTAGSRVSVEDVLIIQVGNGQRDTEDPDLFVTDPEYDFPEDGTAVGDNDDFELIE